MFELSQEQQQKFHSVLDKALESIQEIPKGTPKKPPKVSFKDQPMKISDLEDTQLEELKAKLLLQRKFNFELKKQNAKLNKALAFKQNLSSKLAKLKQNYKDLKNNFMVSEEIRKEYKKVISSLKKQLKV